MKSNLFTLVFAVVLGIVCALVLTATAEFIKPRREANERAERYRNVLHIFNIEIPSSAGNEQIVEMFNKKVVTVGEPEAPQYYLQPVTGPDGRQQNLIAIPAKGPGLWGPIEGLIGLAPDGTTITAVSFYKQEETPGLGGEIAGKDFTSRFVDKKLFDPQGQPALKLTSPGKAGNQYEVDAISGATLTSDKVQSIITGAAEKFRQARKKENN